MRLAWHIVRKDLWSQRWLLVGWCLIIVVNMANRVLGPSLITREMWAWTTVAPWLTAVSLTYSIVPALLVASVIQSDGLIGTTAFWLTRPISRWTMLVAKLLGVFLFVLTPPLVAEAIVMAAYHVSLTTMAGALVQEAWMLGVITLVVALGAAVTSNVPRLVILTIGAGAAVYVWSTVTWLIRYRHFQLEEMLVHGWSRLPQRFADPTSGIMLFSLVGCAALVAIVVQYRRRWPVAAVVIFAVAVLVNVQTVRIWAHVSLFGGEPSLAREPWANGALTVRPGEPLTSRALQDAAVTIDRRPRRVILAPLTIDGMPSGYTPDAYTLTAHLQFADGSKAWSDPSGARFRRLPGDAAGRYWYDERWSVIMNGWDVAFRQKDDQPGHYDALFDIAVYQYETLASLPLAVGAGATDGTRALYVTGFGQVAGYCVIRYEKTAVHFFSDALSSPQLVPRFRLRDGTPLWNPRQDDGAPFGSSDRFDIVPSPGLHPFNLAIYDTSVVYSTRDVSPSGPRCEDIVIEIERVHYAGRLIRTLDLPDLRLGESIAVEEPR